MGLHRTSPAHMFLQVVMDHQAPMDRLVTLDLLNLLTPMALPAPIALLDTMDNLAMGLTTMYQLTVFVNEPFKEDMRRLVCHCNLVILNSFYSLLCTTLNILLNYCV